ncbi:MAG: L-rhamnose mutarotase [Calditrichaeota bacterium]|nr:MAG: L-rhamnose mutarotase [Calditrichota bacterium]
MKRYGSITGLRPEKAAYYKKLHAACWPGVQRQITECNIQNYSIFLKEIDGKLFLFSYFEYTGSDFDADMKKMAADPETQNWWKETDPCQKPLPDAMQKGEIWSMAEEVFHQD